MVCITQTGNTTGTIALLSSVFEGLTSWLNLIDEELGTSLDGDDSRIETHSDRQILMRRFCKRQARRVETMNWGELGEGESFRGSFR